MRLTVGAEELLLVRAHRRDISEGKDFVVYSMALWVRKA